MSPEHEGHQKREQNPGPEMEEWPAVGEPPHCQNPCQGQGPQDQAGGTQKLLYL